MSLETITITDPQHGSTAKILPGVGFNCYGFSIADSSGPLEVLWAAPTFADGTAKPSGSGIPLLFPLAGRIAGTTFTFQGKQYELQAGDGIGNAIHGFVLNRPWRVIEQQQDRVVGQFQASVDDPSLLARWPADFRITSTYQVVGKALRSEFHIENPSDKPPPFGLGLHPYFRVPLGGKSADDCVVKIPVGNNWELKGLVPTGRTDVTPAVANLTAGMKLADMKLDNVFGALQSENHQIVTTIHDPNSGLTLTQEFDDQFIACVVFNPPHREAVCIEPYTTIPDPFALGAREIDPHLRILAPGESFRTKIEIRVG